MAKLWLVYFYSVVQDKRWQEKMQEHLTEDIPGIFGMIDGDGVVGHPPDPTQPFQVGLVNSL